MFVSCDQLTSVDHRAVLLEYALGDNKSSRERCAAFPSFLFYAEDVFETSEVIMLEPADSGVGNLSALLNSEIDTTVGDSDVPTLCKCRYHARNCREPLRVEN